MILLVQNDAEYEVDLRAMIGAFFLGEKVRTAKPDEVAQYDKEMFSQIDIMITALFDEKNTSIRMEEKGRVLYSAYVYGDYTDRKRYRNKLKLAIYRLLSEYTGRSLPWGSLTGMRPTKIASAALAKGKSASEIVDYYNYTYDASEEKAKLATDVAIKEREIIETVNPITDYCLYVGIPFCPTRCLYCSFAAYPLMQYESKVGDYIDCLKKELPFISYLNRNRRLVAIYIGGGTPTSLSAKQLDELMTCINESFDLSSLREYTVEAGRPDSIKKDKLEVLKKRGCTRISINPQTMNADTLRTIGRAHSPAEVKWAMKEARKQGFDNINMDLIAGLPGETIDDVKHTIDELTKLSPDSLTVHSLAIKRASRLKRWMEENELEITMDYDEAMRICAEGAKKIGLNPYYLYRQKQMAGNLENTGYSTPGKEGLYNILIMEEIQSIVAIGAGSVSKCVYPDGRIERCDNVKDIDLYLSQIDEMIERKSKLFCQ